MESERPFHEKTALGVVVAVYLGVFSVALAAIYTINAISDRRRALRRRRAAA
jgi:hypothetical protein